MRFWFVLYMGKVILYTLHLHPFWVCGSKSFVLAKFSKCSNNVSSEIACLVHFA